MGCLPVGVWICQATYITSFISIFGLLDYQSILV